MKIRRINDHTKVVGNVQRCELHLETTTQKGWRHHLDTGYDQFYPDKHWQEVPPEPEWVEVTQDFRVGGDDRWENDKRVLTHPTYSSDVLAEGLQWRKEEGCVKVSELEEQYGLSTTTHPELFILLRALQRPMLTVWEKKP